MIMMIMMMMREAGRAKKEAEMKATTDGDKSCARGSDFEV